MEIFKEQKEGALFSCEGNLKKATNFDGLLK